MTSGALANIRCYFHSDREAVGRCPNCMHYYCRECISEYQSKVICAQCLRKLVNNDLKSDLSWLYLCWEIFCALAGVVLTWFLFYVLAGLLLKIPAEFHEGIFWE